MSELPTKQHEIDRVLEAMSVLMDLGGPDIPDWAAHELTFSQVRLLFLLGRGGPTPMSRIAESIGVGLPTASGAVERLERHGLVARQHRLDDRRVVDCQLTETGRRLIDEIQGFRVEMMRRILSLLDEAEVHDLARIISLVAERAKAGLNNSPDSQVKVNEGQPD